MRFLISIQLLLFFVATDISAQRAHHFGLDVSKTLVNNVLFGNEGRGVVIEPVYLHLNDSTRIKYKVPFGYSNLTRDNIFSNSNMTTCGFYIKPGVGYPLNKRITPYLNLLLTKYSIENKYVLNGNYFGDYIGEYKHDNLFAFGIEPNFDLNFKLYNKFLLIISVRCNFIIYNSASEDYPIYYIPGGGVTINRNLTGGTNIYFVW